jgi:hypothetical protein
MAVSRNVPDKFGGVTVRSKGSLNVSSQPKCLTRRAAGVAAENGHTPETGKPA